jgi:SAM-dependent methyltransferase
VLAQAHAPETPAATVTLERMAGARNYNAWLLERATPYLGRRVLDAGAGLGTFTNAVADGREVVALEPDSNYATRLRERFAGQPNVTVVEAEASSLAVGQGFDSVLCLNVLEHIVDDAGALESFAAALSPGGRLLLLVPAHPLLYGKIDCALDHARRYRRDELQGKLVGAGFAIETLQYVNPLGALGWLVWGRILRRDRVPGQPLRAYDRLTPLLHALDHVPLPFGLSLWTVACASRC